MARGTNRNARSGDCISHVCADSGAGVCTQDSQFLRRAISSSSLKAAAFMEAPAHPCRAGPVPAQETAPQAATGTIRRRR